MAKKSTDKSDYGADSITVLEGLDPVRKRPGMYIGTTGPDGLHHLVWEVFDNSRDEAMSGFADDIEVALLPHDRVRVVDNGRGIPVGIHKLTKVSALETVMTTLHAGGKFDNDSYKVSGGLHGVGVSVVNALSVYARAEVHQDGGAYFQEYSQGKKKAPLKKIGASKLHGTIITFEPDVEIFKEVQFDFNKIVSHLRQQAYLVKKMHITVLDLRAVDEKQLKLDGVFYARDLRLNAPSMSFYFEGGLQSLITFYNHHQQPLHKNIFYCEKLDIDANVVSVEIALQYVDDINSRITAFANNIYNAEGGTHLTGFKTALTRSINTYARKANFLKENDDNFTGDDVLEGLTAAISVKLREVQFEGQTKAKLGSMEAQSAVQSVFNDFFTNFLEEHPDDARAIINKSILALKARKAAKAAKDSVLRKGALDGMTLPGKLADCQTKKAEESELFIVEGDSAGGSAKMGRDRRTQAILPLRGKILNVERARIDRMLTSDSIKDLVVALGTAIGDVFNIEKLRYHKIIIATDADVDGAHIRTLLLTLFFRHFPKVIDGGFLYIAQPPLYKITKGKEVRYAYVEEEKVKVMKELGVEPRDFEKSLETDSEGEEVVENEEEVTEDDAKAKKSAKVNIQRYKGLGEMNPEELWETSMNPANRVLKQVTVLDVAEADNVFSTLMGTDVSARKSFIQSNAKLAQLDI
ncbi:TPA: DNA topoisomerase IV subunit B [Patescibacteria group bacterium]|nr:MAG: gyrase subunit B protein [Parcubacteria group bacterium GW2011_GWD2_42_14]HCC04957.1 DNA topoisomerase IV subunit B [Patescibacteria group bacterium]